MNASLSLCKCSQGGNRRTATKTTLLLIRTAHIKAPEGASLAASLENYIHEVWYWGSATILLSLHMKTLNRLKSDSRRRENSKHASEKRAESIWDPRGSSSSTGSKYVFPNCLQNIYARFQTLSSHICPTTTHAQNNAGVVARSVNIENLCKLSCQHAYFLTL